MLQLIAAARCVIHAAVRFSNTGGIEIMTTPGNTEQVGDQDPEMQNSPIADENDDLEYDLHENVSGLSSCIFNDKTYAHGSIVRSGSTLLRCDRGVWVVAGGSDPDNP